MSSRSRCSASWGVSVGLRRWSWPRGPVALRTKPVYYYNMGCYHASLGHFEQSLAYLERAFEMDGDLRLHAKKDRDLDALRARLEAQHA
ncbi:MAG: hypothetical protein LW645_06720 [Verrucomicrobiaceae bacterium]|nr:hypothetical protein [Verrucomicrobiaceae bacterium]